LRGHNNEKTPATPGRDSVGLSTSAGPCFGERPRPTNFKEIPIMPEDAPRIQPVRVTAIVPCVQINHDLDTNAISLEKTYDVIVRSTFPATIERLNVFVAMDGWWQAGTVHLWLFAPEPMKRILGRVEMRIVGQSDGFIQTYAVFPPHVELPVPGDYQLRLLDTDYKVLESKRLMVELAQKASSRL
jgi:hypothetical protein